MPIVDPETMVLDSSQDRVQVPIPVHIAKGYIDEEVIAKVNAVRGEVP